MKLKFLGAAGGLVTGSSSLINGQTLIDLGMYQGTREVAELNQQPLDFDARKLDAVILTHAHLDHCGRLPLLIKGGFSGKVFMTAATKDLVEIVLFDAVKVAREDGDKDNLFGDEEVEKILLMTEVVEYNQSFFSAGVNFSLIDAGHILGSASVKLLLPDKRKMIFSGDLGNSPQDLIKPTEKAGEGEVVIMESTYGDRLHGVEDEREVLVKEVEAVIRDGGTLLIPAFSLERTQELLHDLDYLKKTGKIKDNLKVFLDSPMAIRVTEVFKKHGELYNEELKKQAQVDDPFDFPGLSMVVEASQSRKIKEVIGAKIIIAGSGMMAGGRILSHAQEYLADSRTRLLFVGYQAKGTIGRAILEGARSVSIYGKSIEVEAHTREITSMSAHADQEQLLTWLEQIKGTREVFLIHGEEKSRRMLKSKIEERLGLKVKLPLMGEEVEV